VARTWRKGRASKYYPAMMMSTSTSCHPKSDRRRELQSIFGALLKLLNSNI
jgi:hypothetical protein